MHYKIINDFNKHLLPQIFLLVVKIKLLVLLSNASRLLTMYVLLTFVSEKLLKMISSW